MFALRRSNRWTLALVFAALLLFPPGSPTEAIAGDTAPMPRLEAAKRYVFAACLTQKYQGQISQEAEAWAGEIVERSDLPAEAFPDLAQFAKSAAPVAGATKSGTELRIESCLDLYNGSALRKHLSAAPWRQGP